mmetsp:Transcript_14684/g.17873  ORF Transcript_14684/g.17873 Transcript_14684/m.17873 type:complete len:266 (+) Transcript_14684:98-895(+)
MVPGYGNYQVLGRNSLSNQIRRGTRIYNANFFKFSKRPSALSSFTTRQNCSNPLLSSCTAKNLILAVPLAFCGAINFIPLNTPTLNSTLPSVESRITILFVAPDLDLSNRNVPGAYVFHFFSSFTNLRYFALHSNNSSSSSPSCLITPSLSLLLLVAVVDDGSDSVVLVIVVVGATGAGTVEEIGLKLNPVELVPEVFSVVGTAEVGAGVKLNPVNGLGGDEVTNGFVESFFLTSLLVIAVVSLVLVGRFSFSSFFVSAVVTETV